MKMTGLNPHKQQNKTLKDVVHFVNGVVVEVIARGKERTVANWIKKVHETSTHTFGKVCVVTHGEY